VKLNPWFRCECGKVHLRSGVGPSTVCTCDRNLWLLAWGKRAEVTP